jgi:hypothetical protein
MGLDDRFPSDWRVAAAVLALGLGALGWVETRMDSVAHAAVAGVAADVDKHKAVDELGTGHLERMIEQVQSDARTTRDLVEKIHDDCVARGGCR